MSTPDPVAICIELMELVAAGRSRELGQRVGEIHRASIALGADGEEVLRLAVETGHPELIEALLPLGLHERAFVVDERERRAYSLATHALSRGFGRVGLVLLAAGTTANRHRISSSAWEAIAAELVAWRELETDQLEPLLDLLGQDAVYLMNRAIRAEREDIVTYLLDHGVRADPRLGAGVEFPLTVAALGGKVSTVRALAEQGARVNARDRDGCTALHRTLQFPFGDENARCRVVLELLRLGAVPDVRNEAQHDAITVAERLGLTAALSLLREHRLAFGPRQSREARAKGVRDVSLYYNKAEGFIYRIGDPDGVFFLGGDYGGAFPTDVSGAASDFDRINDQLDDALGWFRPFLDKLVRGQEFAYAELERFEDRFTTGGFSDWPNWGY